MKNALKLTVAAAAMVGASLFASAPAQADSFGLSFGSRGGIGFSYDTGGYCDRWGCPDGFWDYPIAYCPVFFGDEWYRGPFYYRYRHGEYLYWIHGGWRRDEWDNDRPPGYCEDRFGPALGFDFYNSHGFRWRDDWRRRWDREHGGRDSGFDRGGRDNGWNGNRSVAPFSGTGGGDNGGDHHHRDNGFGTGGGSGFNGSSGSGWNSSGTSGGGTAGDQGHHHRDSGGAGTGGGGSGGGSGAGAGGTSGSGWTGHSQQGGSGTGGGGGGPGTAGTVLDRGAGAGSGGGGSSGHTQPGGSGAPSGSAGTSGSTGTSSGSGSSTPATGDKPHDHGHGNHAEP